jgi:hypothetical protein
MDPIPLALVLVGIFFLVALIVDVFWIVISEKGVYMDEQPDDETPHEMKFQERYDDGFELFLCLSCRRAVMMRWGPGIPLEVYVLDEGKPEAHPSAGRMKVILGDTGREPQPPFRFTEPFKPEPLNFGEPFEMIGADDPSLAPFAAFAEWVEGLDWETEDRKDREE